MASSDAAIKAVYELPLDGKGTPAHRAADGRENLPGPFLLANVRWFCRLRWLVVGIMGAFGVLGLFPALMLRVGLSATPDWPLAAAAVLVLGNILFLVHARALTHETGPRRAHRNLWGQIVFDLLVLTAVVHYAGSLETAITFAYLFHIVLACVFFSGAESLAVTLVACILYTACLLMEDTGLLSPHSIFIGSAPRSNLALTPWIPIWNFGLALGIWLAVWHLTSHLAAMVRARDAELAETNRRLESALDERSRHMLRTTHELKAPFAAIHASTQLLLDGQCGVIPEEALVFIRRISVRCRRLATEIQQMVQLANLRSESQGALPKTKLNVAEVLRWCIGQVMPMAEERMVSIEADLAEAWTTGVDDHLKMLFTNVVGNAVVYSFDGGRVHVRCGPGEDGGATVSVEDHGIGIPADKLRHIFEEYYRTDEAVRHNKQSSGLGLAIVSHVAQEHGIRIRVESRPGVGTTFYLYLPDGQNDPAAGSESKEMGNGIPADR